MTSEEISLKETNEGLVKKSSAYQVLEKESQEEILERIETSIIGESEEKISEVMEQEDKLRSDIPDLASDEKVQVVTDLRETRSDDIDITDKLPEVSKMSESNDMQIPIAVTDIETAKVGDNHEHELQNETQNVLAQSENESDISTGEMTIDRTREQTLMVNSELNTERSTGFEEQDIICVGKLETPNNAELPNNDLGIDEDVNESPVNYKSDEACSRCTDTEQVVTEEDNSAEASKSSLTNYMELEKSVVEPNTGEPSHKTEDLSIDDSSVINEEVTNQLNLLLVHDLSYINK